MFQGLRRSCCTVPYGRIVQYCLLHHSHFLLFLFLFFSSSLRHHLSFTPFSSVLLLLSLLHSLLHSLLFNPLGLSPANCRYVALSAQYLLTHQQSPRVFLSLRLPHLAVYHRLSNQAEYLSIASPPVHACTYPQSASVCRRVRVSRAFTRYRVVCLQSGWVAGILLAGRMNCSYESLGQYTLQILPILPPWTSQHCWAGHGHHHDPEQEELCRRSCSRCRSSASTAVCRHAS